jgi:hypothetical protein
MFKLNTLSDNKSENTQQKKQITKVNMRGFLFGKSEKGK